MRLHNTKNSYSVSVAFRCAFVTRKHGDEGDESRRNKKKLSCVFAIINGVALSFRMDENRGMTDVNQAIYSVLFFFINFLCGHFNWFTRFDYLYF